MRLVDHGIVFVTHSQDNLIYKYINEFTTQQKRRVFKCIKNHAIRTLSYFIYYIWRLKLKRHDRNLMYLPLVHNNNNMNTSYPNEPLLKTDEKGPLLRCATAAATVVAGIKLRVVAQFTCSGVAAR